MRRRIASPDGVSDQQMMHRIQATSVVTAAALIALTACATSATALDDSWGSASPNSVRLRLTSATTASGTKETLTLRATIQNGTDTEFRRLGCTSPAVALDSATATGWAELPAEQLASLAICVSPYYIVSAGTSQSFETSFVRTSPATRVPRGVALRLRVIGATPEAGPVAPVILP